MLTSSLCLAASKAFLCNPWATMERLEALKAQLDAIPAQLLPPAQPPPLLYDRHLFVDWEGRCVGWWPPADGRLLAHPSQLIGVAHLAVRQGLQPDQVPAVLCVPPPNAGFSGWQAHIMRVRGKAGDGVGQVTGCDASINTGLALA